MMFLTFLWCISLWHDLLGWWVIRKLWSMGQCFHSISDVVVLCYCICWLISFFILGGGWWVEGGRGWWVWGRKS